MGKKKGSEGWKGEPIKHSRAAKKGWRNRVKYGFYKVKEKTYDKFDQRDVAQMLTSLFVITQVFVINIPSISFNQAIMIAIFSSAVCVLILRIISKSDFLKHFVAGALIVGISSMFLGYILNTTAVKILVAFSIGFPVAAMVNVLKQ